jgi:hypothetical protein
MTRLMHDWSLLSLNVDWAAGAARIVVRSPSGEASIRATGLYELHAPRRRSWGPSASINTVKGPTQGTDEHTSLIIEMQSGDSIRIVARAIEMPA